MKTVLVVFVVLLVVIGCRSTREINVEMVSAQLIKIDTVFRGSNEPKQQLTWRDKDDIEYVSLVSMSRLYPLGLTMNLLRQR
jgi:uncharacterized protein YcfL